MRSTAPVWNTGVLPASILEHPVDRLVERRGVGQVGHPELVHQHRPVLGAASGADQGVEGLAQHDPSLLDRHRPHGDDVVATGIEAGQLQIQGAPAGLAPRRLARGPGDGGELGRHALRRSAQPHVRSPRCTPDTARNTSRSWSRVSGLSVAGSS